MLYDFNDLISSYMISYYFLYHCYIMLYDCVLFVILYDFILLYMHLYDFPLFHSLVLLGSNQKRVPRGTYLDSWLLVAMPLFGRRWFRIRQQSVEQADTILAKLTEALKGKYEEY